MSSELGMSRSELELHLAESWAVHMGELESGMHAAEDGESPFFAGMVADYKSMMPPHWPEEPVVFLSSALYAAMKSMVDTIEANNAVVASQISYVPRSGNRKSA